MRYIVLLVTVTNIYKRRMFFFKFQLLPKSIKKKCLVTLGGQVERSSRLDQQK